MTYIILLTREFKIHSVGHFAIWRQIIIAAFRNIQTMISDVLTTGNQSETERWLLLLISISPMRTSLQKADITDINIHMTYMLMQS